MSDDQTGDSSDANQGDLDLSELLTAQGESGEPETLSDLLVEANQELKKNPDLLEEEEDTREETDDLSQNNPDDESEHTDEGEGETDPDPEEGAEDADDASDEAGDNTDGDQTDESSSSDDDPQKEFVQISKEELEQLRTRVANGTRATQERNQEMERIQGQLAQLEERLHAEQNPPNIADPKNPAHQSLVQKLPYLQMFERDLATATSEEETAKIGAKYSSFITDEDVTNYNAYKAEMVRRQTDPEYARQQVAQQVREELQRELGQHRQQVQTAQEKARLVEYYKEKINENKELIQANGDKFAKMVESGMNPIRAIDQLTIEDLKSKVTSGKAAQAKAKGEQEARQGAKKQRAISQRSSSSETTETDLFQDAWDAYVKEKGQLPNGQLWINFYNNYIQEHGA